MTQHGWTLPLTPDGTSSVVCAPPWHFSGDCIAVDYRADPDKVASLCPPGMEPEGSGEVSIVFADWRSAADADPRLGAEPSLSQYYEAFFVIYGTFDGEPVSRVPFMWVSSDTSLVRGFTQGLPKKLGDIAMTRPIELGIAGVRRSVGSRFAASLSAGGRRLVTLAVDLEEERTDDDFWPRAASAPYLNTRHFPSFDGRPSVHELAIFQLDNIERGRVLTGSASFQLGRSDREEIDLLAPTEVGKGSVYSMAFSLTGCRTFSAG